MAWLERQNVVSCHHFSQSYIPAVLHFPTLFSTIVPHMFNVILHWILHICTFKIYMHRTCRKYTLIWSFDKLMLNKLCLSIYVFIKFLKCIGYMTCSYFLKTDVKGLSFDNVVHMHLSFCFLLFKVLH